MNTSKRYHQMIYIGRHAIVVDAIVGVEVLVDGVAAADDDDDLACIRADISNWN